MPSTTSTQEVSALLAQPGSPQSGDTIRFSYRQLPMTAIAVLTVPLVALSVVSMVTTSGATWPILIVIAVFGALIAGFAIAARRSWVEVDPSGIRVKSSGYVHPYVPFADVIGVGFIKMLGAGNRIFLTLVQPHAGGLLPLYRAPGEPRRGALPGGWRDRWLRARYLRINVRDLDREALFRLITPRLLADPSVVVPDRVREQLAPYLHAP